MQLRIERVDVQAGDAAAIAVEWSSTDDRISWSLTNVGSTLVAVEAVALVARLEPAVEPLQVLRHGYQSWSATGVATFRVDQDPSRPAGVPSLVRGMHHADSGVSEPDELRSELVTALRDATGAVLVAGFLGGTEHDGTFRVRPARDGSTAIEVWIEAHLGGALLGVDERRELHDVWMGHDEHHPGALLCAWADELGAAQQARTDAGYQVGWCSWYHYFHDVTEADLRANLAHAADWPFDVFQLDDGFQADIGDWLITNERFPTPLDGLAAAIAAEGRVPGIWLAPFLAGPGSALAVDHPTWTARHRTGDAPLVGMVNPGWGGIVHTLDTTDPEVLDHLESVARSLAEAGFSYLKLDFTYAPSLPGVYADPSRTPAQRVRAGFEAIRRGAGPDAFLLGCGAPLGPAVGLVDGMRIGPDVAPWWHPNTEGWHPPGHEDGEPATVNAWRNTLSRSFLHRRLWLNDPDCLMLRTERTQLSEDQVRAWALAVAASGGMALVSDDLALLDGDARTLLDDVLAVGRAVDAAARRGDGPRCEDLLEVDPPTRLLAPGYELVGDPAHGTAYLQARLG
ncbi:MAG TPA: glycoside hydrolase family 36 protein [Acidimicrobiales bacterium]|nr:glycoside hydrolase family 36 protein [Acidimicrobiales bacterium]